ncbi:hypothetical protein B0H16DRAFT_1476231 [Mycena metata]|uniref:Uncharacterized protein n=1 Tax=Mycena metata TaxID=1033252 RepID=A0AAD7HDC1_9AGAR|nr:hypothetical protein B0H16DRAFT_1476231 [Mycena metata]
MGLAEDRAEFTKLQAVIHALAVEAKLDFELPWSQQEPMTIVKISRVNLSRPRNATTICVRSDSRATGRHNQSFNIISTVSARTNLAKLIPPVEFHVAARVRPKLEGGKLRRRDHPTKILASFYHLLPIHNKVNYLFLLTQWIWITTLVVEMTYFVLLLNRVSRSTPSDEEESDNGSTNDNSRDLTAALKTTRMGMRTI